MKTLIKRVRDNFCVGRKTKVLLSLFVLSLCVRLVFFLPVAKSGMAPDYDEALYYHQAASCRTILVEILHGRIPAGETFQRAYAYGWWPLLHPAVCGLGLLLFGETAEAARFVVVLISAATTPLVFILALRLASRKAAYASALAHIFYPSFIAYSHYLWSETTYIFLLLLAVFFAARLLDAQARKKRIIFAALTGFSLGLCVLTRVAVLPILPVLACLLAWALKTKMEKLLLPAVVLLASVITILPWEYALISQEKHFILLSTSGSSGLYMGNNPWVPKEIGSSRGVASHAYSGIMGEDIRKFMETHRVDRNTAMNRLAMREIRGDYWKFFVRCSYRLRMLWSNDYYVLRHILHANYPSLPHFAAAFIWGLVILSYITMMGLAAIGFLTQRSRFHHRSLLLILTLAGMLPPILTLAVARFHIPLLALMLPAVGVGAMNVKSVVASARGFVVAIVIIAISTFSATTTPAVLSNFICPSSYYMGLIDRVDRMFGASTLYTDIVVFRARDGVAPPGKIRMRLLNEGSRFHRPDGIECEWDAGRKKARRFVIRSRQMEGPLRISILSEASGKASVIEPIRPQCWWEWQPVGIDGIEYKWAVSGSFDPN